VFSWSISPLLSFIAVPFQWALHFFGLAGKRPSRLDLPGVIVGGHFEVVMLKENNQKRTKKQR